MKFGENIQMIGLLRNKFFEKLKMFIKKNMDIIIIATIIVFLCHLLVYTTGIGYVKGNSFKMYNRLHSPFYIETLFPENPKEFKYAYFNIVRGACSRVSFTVDKQEYENYLEFIKNSDIYKTGNNKYTGLKVSEAYKIEEENSYDNFTDDDCKSVIKDDIEDYTIVYYYSEDSGFRSKNSFIVVNEETGRFVLGSSGSD